MLKKQELTAKQCKQFRASNEFDLDKCFQEELPEDEINLIKSLLLT